MNEDKFLKDLLSDYHPQLSDDNAFMQRLQRQMELIEEVKAYQRAESRKNKLMSLKTACCRCCFGLYSDACKLHTTYYL